MYKLWVGTQKVWGSDALHLEYFKNKYQRDKWVHSGNYREPGGTVYITDSQYHQWEKYGMWEPSYN